MVKMVTTSRLWSRAHLALNLSKGEFHNNYKSEQETRDDEDDHKKEDDQNYKLVFLSLIC